MMQPDDRTVFRRTLDHQPHERFLYYCDFTQEMARKMAEALGLPEDELSARLGLFRPARFGVADCYGGRPDWRPDFWRYYADMDVKEGSTLDENGVLHEPGSLYHFTHYVAPLRGEADLGRVEEFPFRTMIPGSEAGLDREIAAAKARGRVTEAWVGHIYENAWQIRGYEEFLADMALCPRVSDAILERIASRNRECAVAMARSGVDMIRTGDDVAGQQGMIFGADRWRKTLKPLWKDVYAAARAVNPDVVVWYHSDGNVMDIIEDLIEIGVNILNPVQPECMDLALLKREYGSRLVFDGAVGTQSVMPFGTPEQVRDTVRRMKDLLGAGGGLVLSPTHVLEPEVPVENVLAFVEACREA